MHSDPSSLASYSVSGGLTLYGLQMSDLAAIAGVLLGVLTFVYNVHCKRRQDAREERLLQAREAWYLRTARADPTIEPEAHGDDEE